MRKSWKTSECDFEMDTAGPTGEEELMRLRLSSGVARIYGKGVLERAHSARKFLSGSHTH